MYTDAAHDLCHTASYARHAMYCGTRILSYSQTLAHPLGCLCVWAAN